MTSNKQFEKAVLTAFYTAFDSQGVDIPEEALVEALGPHINIKDAATGNTVSVIYIVKPVKKPSDDRRNDMGSIQRSSEQDQKRTL